MNGAALLDELREEYETELSRLGSSKAIYAVTGGEMTGDAVLEAAATEAATAERVFDGLADDETDDDAAALFETIAADAADHREATGVDDEEIDLDDDRADYETLAGLTSTPERVGGALGRSLVTGRLVDQTVGFFVGNADPGTADTFRSVSDDVADHRDRAAGILGEVCATDDDRDAARAAARAVIEAAYEFYVDTLESMGVEPKNVC